MKLKSKRRPPVRWRACLNSPTARIPGHIIKTDDACESPILLVPKGTGLNGEMPQVLNAILAAAAPELLSVCKDAVAHLNGKQIPHLQRRITAAIHKATRLGSNGFKRSDFTP